MQVYRELAIGTAKPTAAERAMAPHHLVDCIPPSEDFSAADYGRRARKIVAELLEVECQTLRETIEQLRDELGQLEMATDSISLNGGHY